MATFHVLGSSLILCIFLQIFPTIDSAPESEALLKLKQSFTNSSSLDSWKPGTQPCGPNPKWIGIVCVNGLVSSLRLKNLGLSGKIDIDALASLSTLVSVGFISNSFSGPLPDFSRMRFLKGLYLSRNKFSGEIPADYFRSMVGLKKVWLSGNMFTGRAPDSLFQLPNLMELRLDNNQFSGVIPPPRLPSLVFLDASNNRFEGEIPSSLSRFAPGAFMGNPGLLSGSPPPMATKRSTNPNLMWAMVASAVVILVVVAAVFALKWWHEDSDDIDECTSFRISSVRRTDGVTSRGEKIVLGPPKARSRKGSNKFGKGVEIVMINDGMGEFTMNDLMKAAADVLSNGALMSSYKAVMLTGLTVVVKRIKENVEIGKEQFDRDMRMLGGLRHDNVLTPLAYHYRRDEKLLVSEYMPKGSLQYALHGERGVAHAELNWPIRLKIIQGIARGLAYLHAQLSTLALPHGNLKSSNVLLTENNEPLLSEYGLCLVISGSSAAQALEAYKAPEAVLDHNISPKCDVYCLGIIILEILTGKFPALFVRNGDSGLDAVQWIRSALLEGRECDIFDPNIKQTEESREEMKRLLYIGAACTESRPEQRPDVREALRRIEDVTSLVERRSHEMTTIQIED